LVVSNAYGCVTGLVAQLSVSRILAWGDNSAGQLDVPIGTTDVVALATGGDHNLALRGNATIVAWGDNSSGQNNIPQSASDIIAVADGESHSLALRADGSVVAWGDNSYAQTNVPPSATNAVSIAAGRSHSSALLIDGTVLAWGSNSSQQTNVPSSATNGVAIAAGGDCSLALRADGIVVAWGNCRAAPASATNIVSIAAGDNDALALRADGTLFVWGGNYYGQTSVPTSVTNVVAITAGGDHILELLADTTTTAWGADYFGQTLVPPQATNVIAISAGGAHNLALVGSPGPRVNRQPISCSVHNGQPVVLTTSSTGTFPLSWQWFHDGVLISGATEPFLLLTSVQRADAGKYTVRVLNALGETNSQAATLEVLPEPFLATATTIQTVLVGMPASFSPVTYGEQPISYRWQRSGTDLLDGSRVTGAASPRLSISQTELADTGDYNLVVSNAFGLITGLVAHLSVTPVAAWGYNNYGQTNVPPAATNVLAIAAGGYGSLVLRGDGTVVAWGYNSYGQTNVPPWATNVVAITAGGSHNLVLRADGAVVAWGYNYYGQTNVPPWATNVIAIAAGGSYSLALRADGTVVAWGYNSNGQTNVPPWATNVVAIAASSSHSLALCADGAVVAWGYNYYGQTNVPLWATNVVAIAAGSSHSLALRADGVVVAWGYNYYGQTNVPPWATNVVAIAAGDNHSMALRADGVVVAWGYNYYGQTNVPPWATNVVAIAAGAYHSMALVSDKGQVSSFQPIGRAATVGTSALLTAGSLGRARASFQWQLNGMDLLGATNAALWVGFANWTNAGVYRVMVSNVFGSTLGPPMVLSVLRTPLLFDTSPEGLHVTNDALYLRLLGASGVGPVVLFASTNSLTWQPILTNPAVIGPLELSDTGISSRPGRFYRATEGEAPGPLYIELAATPFQARNGMFPLLLTGLTAQGPVVIYASSNLVDWEAVFTNPPSIGPLQYLEGPSTIQPQRFYRASEER